MQHLLKHKNLIFFITPLIISDPTYDNVHKSNIETGEEIKILDGGMYPHWRWPGKKL